MTALVCVPDWQDAADDHWQSLWIRDYPNSARVYQRDWRHPERAEWVRALQQTLSEQDEIAVLAAHGVGCSTVVHWAAHASPEQLRRVKGVLLVAPPDVAAATFQTSVGASGFTPEPDWALPFASIVAASSDDPFCSQEHAQALAQAWGSEFVALGAVGHVSTDRQLGSWRVGQKLLQRLMLA
jgi:predicted alpha/beta hydrolase family esterase